MSLALHKVCTLHEDEETQSFLFVLNDPLKLRECRSMESDEINYGGQSWALVLARKEDAYLGVYLKWRYSDGNSVGSVSAKAKFGLNLIHQTDFENNARFSTTQKFNSGQTMLGKTKLISMKDFLDPSSGFLDSTGSSAVFEIVFNYCQTKFEKNVDVSPSKRTHKNASGIYFDTNSFVIANNRWYLRFYTNKLNSNGLPAIYLYLVNSSSNIISFQIQFVLYIQEASTEILCYNFGEGAKFDGFGKTLPDQFSNPDKLTEVNVSVEIKKITVFKIVSLKITKSIVSTIKSPSGILKHSKALTPARARSPAIVNQTIYTSTMSLQSGIMKTNFQDNYGGLWKIENTANDLNEILLITFDKAVYSFQNSKTQILCWTGLLMSRDLNTNRDVPMNGFPCVGYFSNLNDEKGHHMSFPVLLSQLEDNMAGFIDENGCILIRLDFLSIQTSSYPCRSGPKFDYLVRHLTQAKQDLQATNRNLLDMKEMGASMASLSLLMDEQQSHSESSTSSGLGLNNLSNKNPNGSLVNRVKSYESLDDSSLSENHLFSPTEPSTTTISTKNLFIDFLQNISKVSHLNTINASNFQINNNIFENSDITNLSNISSIISSTSKNKLNGTNDIISSNLGIFSKFPVKTTRIKPLFNDKYTENKFLSYDEPTMLTRARSNMVEDKKNKEIIGKIIDILKKKAPFNISRICELGSIGSDTCASNRIDVDLILFSYDIPTSNSIIWMPALLLSLQTILIQNFLQENYCNFTITAFALQFNFEEIDVDIILTHDYDTAPNDSNLLMSHKLLFDMSMNDQSNIQWYSIACSRLKKRFFLDLKNEVKDIIKLLKYWRNTVTWSKTEFRPNSYLLSLLVAKACEETKVFNMKNVLLRVKMYLLTPELKLTWNIFYNPANYELDFHPPTPLILDPCNAAVNVASSLEYWGEFKREYLFWIDALKI